MQTSFCSSTKEYRTYINIMLHLLLGWRWSRDLHHNVRWLTSHLSFEALQLFKKKKKKHVYKNFDISMMMHLHIAAF